MMNILMNSMLKELYDQQKIVRKILRSLTEDFRPKVTVITKSKDVDSIPVDDIDDCGFDDEFSHLLRLLILLRILEIF